MKVFQDFNYDIQYDYTDYQKKEGKRDYAVVFKYMGNEKNVVIPDEIEGYPVTEMSGTFAGKEELERVTLPKKLETLGFATFQGCSKLKTIHFPSSLKKIGINAFMNCTSLEEITVSDSAALIEKMSLDLDVFEDCPKLCDENDFIILKTLLLAYQGTESQVTIPDGITKISEAAFYDNRIVTSVVMPDSVTIMGKQAFYQCVNLIEITLSKELKTIGQEAFFDCKKLEQISLPEQVKEIENGVFSNCVSLKEIQWSENLQLILDEAFSGCYSLEEISFPENLNCIKKSFVGCINLRKITIPPSVHTVDKKAFDKCDSLEIIDILERPEGTIKLYLLMSCFPYSAKMRENVLKKGQEVPQIIAKTFSKAHTEQYLTDLFSSWDKLSETAKDLIREEWGKKISSKVKKGKNRLRNLVFLESTAKEMGMYFNEGFHLELPELEEYLEFSIKNENTAETAVLLDYKNKTYSKDYLEELETRKELVDIGLELPTLKELREKWTVRATKYDITITGYKGKNTHEIIPETIDTGVPIRCLSTTRDIYETSSYNPIETLVLPQTFQKTVGKCFNLATLKEIILPDNLTEIVQEMFREAKNLEKIIFPKNISIIRKYAFFYCVSLKEVCFSSQLEFIEQSAFELCTSIEEIKLPKSLKKVDVRAFADCKKLKKVILESGTVEIDPTAFVGCEVLEFVGTEDGENFLHKFKSNK